MRISYWSAILVFLLASCSASETPPAGSLAFVGPGIAQQQVSIGEGATIEVTVVNKSSAARSLGKLVFSANGAAVDAQFLDLEGGQLLTFRFYHRPGDPGIYNYDVDLYQGKTKLETLRFSLTAIPALVADLGWVSAGIAPLKALSDTTVHVDAVVQNFGQVRAFATVEVRVLSAANTDVTVGRFSLPSMEAGATAPVSVDLTVFGNIAGTARLVLQASTPDTDTTNDTITMGPLDVVAPNWHLSLLGPINVAASSPIPVTALVFNRTEFTLPPHSFELLRGAPGILNIDLATPFPSRIPIPALPPGAGVFITSYQLAPNLSSIDAGATYPLWARLVDDVDKPQDSSDDNIGQTAIRVYDQLPDLAAISITAATHLGAGGMQLTVLARFANAGSNPTPAPYEIWLTGPQNVRLLAARYPTTFFSNMAQNLVTSVTLPALVNGAYAVRVTLDAQREILELREDNNTAVDPTALIIAPDVAATITSFAPASIAPNGAVDVRVTWSNAGNATPAGTASLWMVSGATEKTQDFVKTLAVPALGYNEQVISDYTVQPLRGHGAYAWVVSAASAAGESDWDDNRFKAATPQNVVSVLTVVSRGPLSDPNPDTTAVADIDTDNEAEKFWGSADGFLFAARVSDASTLWPARDFDGLRVHPPALADLNGDLVLDVVVTAGGRADGQFGPGTLAALDGTDGTVFWSRVESGLSAVEYVAPPAVGDVSGDGIPDVILAAGGSTGSGYVAAISGGTGAQLWSLAGSGIVGGAAIITDINGDARADVFGATVEGDMAVLSGKTGAFLWTSSANVASIASSPAIGNIDGSAVPEIILAGIATDLTSVTVLAIDSVTGSERWRFQTRGTSVGAPVIVDVTGDGLGEVVVSVTVVDDGKVGHSKLLILNGNGTAREVVEVYGAVPGAPRFSDDGSGLWNLGFATTGPSRWVEVATPYNSGNPAPWPKYRGNSRNTGRFGD